MEYIVSKESSIALRDFVYLDIERVKSLLAQLDQGLLTDRADTVDSSRTIEGHGGLRIPALAELGGTSEFMFRNQATETRTLHDYIYNQTEAKLIDIGRVIRLPEDFDSKALMGHTVRSQLSHVTYILVHGYPYMSDYRWMATVLNDVNELIKTMTEFSFAARIAGTKGTERSRLEQEKNSTIKSAQINPQQVRGYSKILDQFYRDRLVVKILPFDDPDVRIVGPLRPEFLRDRMDDIRFKYGSAPTAKWTVFGQVASIPSREIVAPPSGQYFSNEVEGAMDQMFVAMRDLERFFGVSYPEIAITPIAIFRE